MITNKAIPFRPKLEGEFRTRFYTAVQAVTEETRTTELERIASEEVNWAEHVCSVNLAQRKKYRAVWMLLRDLISISTELPCSGSIEMLPTYENKTNRYLGYDGTQSIPEILSRWVAFAPYTRNEVRICTVDAPDMPSILKSFRDSIEKGICDRIVYNAYLTRSQNGNSELAKLDYMISDYEVGEYIKSGKISISIQNLSSAAEIKKSSQFVRFIWPFTSTNPPTLLSMVLRRKISILAL